MTKRQKAFFVAKASVFVYIVYVLVAIWINALCDLSNKTAEALAWTGLVLIIPVFALFMRADFTDDD